MNIIYDGLRFSVTSYYNGLSYLWMTKAEPRRVLHLQGDNATTFRDLWDDFETADPDRPADDILSEIWTSHGYVDASNPVAPLSTAANPQSWHADQEAVVSTIAKIEERS